MSEQIEIKIDGPKLTPDKFEEAVRAFFTLLRGVTKNLSGHSEDADWCVTIDSGSAILMAHADTPNSTPASIFHAMFGQEAGRVEGCKAIHKGAQEGLVQIYTSAISFVECVWIKGKPDKFDPSHEQLLSVFFAHKYIRVVNCDRMLAEQARQLIWKFPHLKPKDAIHVATAIFQQVDVLHTYDNDDLVKLSGKVGAPPLRIENPPPPPAVS